MVGTAGAAGVVFGCLTPDGDIDRTATRTLLQEARPLPVTFHRAFDVSRDPRRALETLIDIGVERLLTSGQQPTAPQGLELIAELVTTAAGRIIIMPGVGIDATNVLQVAAATGACEFHIYTERSRDSSMRFRQQGIPMGRSYEPDEYSRPEPDPEEITAIARALHQHATR